MSRAPSQKCPKCGDMTQSRWREDRILPSQSCWDFYCLCGYSWSRDWKPEDAR